MDDKINLKEEENSNNFNENINNESIPKKSNVKRLLKITTYCAIFIFIVYIAFSSQIISTNEEGSTSWIARLPIISHIKRLVESADKKLKGEDRGKINILLLGMGGKNHEGGLLADTIMLASLDTIENKVALLSIPRDLSAPIEGKGWKKVNNINAYAEVQSSGSGGLAMSQAIGDLLDIPIDYYLRVDFQGFINIIDELGGIDVYVENTIDDPSYPILGMEEAEPYSSRYKHLVVKKGDNYMDGELALKFVRSRHTPGYEGSDFARSRRQQKIIEAVKEEVISKYILFKPMMVANIIGELDEHVSTNLKIWEIVKLWNMFKDINNQDIVNRALDNSPNGLLVDMISESGAYILVPTSGDFAEIQYMVNNIFSDAPIKTRTRVITEKTSIEILNGTWVNGLASRVALDLDKYGFEIIRVSNYNQQNFEKSFIYDLTYGEKINSLTILKEKTNADINFGIPEWLITDLADKYADEKDMEQPDFILIVGQDADTSASGLENPDE